MEVKEGTMADVHRGIHRQVTKGHGHLADKESSMEGDAISARLYLKAVELAQIDSDSPEVIGLLEQSSSLGNIDAMFALAIISGRGKTKSDRKKCFRLMKSVADRGHPTACYNVAVSYEKADGVAMSEMKAFFYYLRSALLGDRDGAFELYRCIYFGIGISSDKTTAKFLKNEFKRRGQWAPR